MLGSDLILSSLKYGLELNAGIVVLAWRTWSSAVDFEQWSLRQALTPLKLWGENQCFRDTGGVSQCNRVLGFVPAFQDKATGCVYPSIWADGRPSPIHTLDGLPSELILERDSSGRPTAVKSSLVSGFVREGCFFTREQAARLLASQGTHHPHSSQVS